VKALFAKERLVEARSELDNAENLFRLFLESNRNYVTSSDPAVRLKGNRLENELKLRTQLVGSLAVSFEQALMEEKNDMPILNVLDAGNLPIEKSRPGRSAIVMLSALLAGSAYGLWINRIWVLTKFAL
jgi:hypothetical protein